MCEHIEIVVGVVFTRMTTLFLVSWMEVPSRIAKPWNLQRVALQIQI